MAWRWCCDEPVKYPITLWWQSARFSVFINDFVEGGNVSMTSTILYITTPFYYTCISIIYLFYVHSRINVHFIMITFLCSCYCWFFFFIIIHFFSTRIHNKDWFLIGNLIYFAIFKIEEYGCNKFKTLWMIKKLKNFFLVFD